MVLLLLMMTWVRHKVVSMKSVDIIQEFYHTIKLLVHELTISESRLFKLSIVSMNQWKDKMMTQDCITYYDWW